jgi:hypothetical protein
VVNFKPPPLYLWNKNHQYPLNRGLGGTQSRSGRGGEGKKSHQCPCRELNSGRPTCGLVYVIISITSGNSLFKILVSEIGKVRDFPVILIIFTVICFKTAV